MAAISEKGATLQPKCNSLEDVIVKNSLYKADKVASKLSFNRKELKNMKNMQEDEFDKIERTNLAKLCKHEVVRLYQFGSHSDYGCIKCGMKSLIIEDFRIKK